MKVFISFLKSFFLKHRTELQSKIFPADVVYDDCREHPPSDVKRDLSRRSVVLPQFPIFFWLSLGFRFSFFPISTTCGSTCFWSFSIVSFYASLIDFTWRFANLNFRIFNKESQKKKIYTSLVATFSISAALLDNKSIHAVDRKCLHNLWRC